MNQVEQVAQILTQASEVEEQLQQFLSGLAANNSELKTFSVSIALLSQGLHALAVLHVQNPEQYTNMVCDLAEHIMAEAKEEVDGGSNRES